MATTLASKRAKFARCPREECDHWRSLVWESPWDDTLANAFVDWAMETGGYSRGTIERELRLLRDLAAEVKVAEAEITIQLGPVPPGHKAGHRFFRPHTRR